MQEVYVRCFLKLEVLVISDHEEGTWGDVWLWCLRKLGRWYFPIPFSPLLPHMPHHLPKTISTWRLIFIYLEQSSIALGVFPKTVPRCNIFLHALSHSARTFIFYIWVVLFFGEEGKLDQEQTSLKVLEIVLLGNARSFVTIVIALSSDNRVRRSGSASLTTITVDHVSHAAFPET